MPQHHSDVAIHRRPAICFSSAHLDRGGIGALAAEDASATKRPQRSIFRHFLDQYPDIGAAKASKTILAGATFRFRRLLPPRLLAIEKPSAGLKLQSALAASLAMALLALSAGTSAFAQGSTDRSSQQTHADIWRATSRLGYAPTVASAEAARPNPQAWALQEVDAAYAASQRPLALPAELADVAKPLGEVARGYQVERETRRLAPNGATTGNLAAAAAAATAIASMERATAGTMDAETVNFSRDMAQAAAAWRVASCSNPALEQPLLSRMTECWFNHLNVFVGKGAVRPFVGNYLIEVIRPNALGRFEDLLLASAHHPAMLFYLDQASSNAKGINENYARELMELHTMGVNSGYTQGDVRELARILTGWTAPLRDGEGFAFNNRQHDQGQKVLLGQTFGANGVREGEDAIRMLARQPATAVRICHPAGRNLCGGPAFKSAGEPAGQHFFENARRHQCGDESAGGIARVLEPQKCAVQNAAGVCLLKPDSRWRNARKARYSASAGLFVAGRTSHARLADA